MHGREFINNTLNSYFTLVTLISIFMLVAGINFYPTQRFGYEAYAFPLIYGACGILPQVVMYSKRELTMVEFLVRKVIQLVLIEILVLGVVFGGSDISAEETGVIVVTGIGIMVIYVVSHIVDWIQKCLSARKMTEDLVKLQQENLMKKRH